MRVRDLPEILRIERLSFPTPWTKGAFLSELLENDRAYYLVARVGERAVGYVGVWIIVDEGHITNIAVHPDFRGRGIGRQLLRSIMELGRKKGARRFTLEVRKSNLVAQNLYRSLGFVEIGVRRGYYLDNNEDAIIMSTNVAATPPAAEPAPAVVSAPSGETARTPAQPGTGPAAAWRMVPEAPAASPGPVSEPPGLSPGARAE